jgi:hypothetical protein
MHNQLNDAARPLEIVMNKPFEVTDDGKVRIVGGVIRDNAQAVLNYLNAQVRRTELSPLVAQPLSHQ